MKDILAVGRRIEREFHPRQIVLFGSHARGDATADSDVDLLVVMPFRGRSADKSVEITLRVKPGFAADILVRSPQTVRRRIAMGDCFMQEIVTNGKVLFEEHRR